MEGVRIPFRPLRRGFGRPFSTRVEHDFQAIARDVHEHVNRITSLWGMRDSRVKSSKYFENDLMLKLAAKHLGHRNTDDLLSLSQVTKTGKWNNQAPTSRIVYEESINRDVDLTDNDIWLGHSRYISFVNVSLRYASRDLKRLLASGDSSRTGGEGYKDVGAQGVEAGLTVKGEELEEISSLLKQLETFTNGSTDGTTVSTTDSMTTSSTDAAAVASSGADDVEVMGEMVRDGNYTILIFPYLRRTSKIILDALDKGRNLISDSDLRSIIYSAGSTGSSRLLRFLSQLMSERFTPRALNSIFNDIESYAWPWMAKGEKEKGTGSNLTLVLDALAACSIIKFTPESEAKVYDYLIMQLKELDDMISSQTATASSGTCDDAITTDGSSSVGDELAEFDNVLLEKVLILLLLKKNFNQFGNEQIRAFSDYVCDRLHRIRPKILANIAYTLGYSKNLDEFWMFMLSKQILQLLTASAPSTICPLEVGSPSTTTTTTGSSGPYDPIRTSSTTATTTTTAVGSSEGTPTTEKTSANSDQELLGRFDEDDITAILDSYSNAGLEDFNFYSTVCNAVKDEFEHYSLYNKNVIISSLAKIRHKDDHLHAIFIASLKDYIRQLLYPADTVVGASTGGAGSPGKLSRRALLNAKEDELRRRAYLIKPVDSYMVASAIVSACDLDFRVDDIDDFWRVLTMKVKESAFDICAISWLPIATITFPSLVALGEFLPAWLRHVSYTINKLRSKTFMSTVQRRQLLLRHAFNLGMLPPEYLTPKCAKYLNEICDKKYITCKDDYVPESSTFHLEVCACLGALGVPHQREFNILPFVMDIVVPSERLVEVKSSLVADAERETDVARAGNLSLESHVTQFALRYTRNSPNHRKHKVEIYKE